MIGATMKLLIQVESYKVEWSDDGYICYRRFTADFIVPFRGRGRRVHLFFCPSLAAMIMMM